MNKALSWLQKSEKFVLVVAFIIMVLASFVQVVNRNIVHAGISWLEELSRYCMVYMALLAAEVGLRDGTQISLTTVTDHMNVSLRKIVFIVGKLVLIAFAVVTFVSSFSLLSVQIASGQITPGLRIPMFVPFLAIPISFAIIILVQVGILIKMIMEAFHKEEITEEGEA